MRKLVAGIALVGLLILAVTVLAGENKGKKGGEHVTMDGKLVCMGCDLKKGEGARAACAEFGHKHALKTKDGKYISLLQNKYSADLLTGKHHDKDATIHGVYFAKANMLDVETYAIGDEKQVSWCNHCKGMDACASK